jgi:hypothetical protein
MSAICTGWLYLFLGGILMKDVASVSLFVQKVEKVSTRSVAGLVSETGFFDEMATLFGENPQAKLDPKALITSFMQKTAGKGEAQAVKDMLGEVKQVLKDAGLFKDKDIDGIFDLLLNPEGDVGAATDVFSTILILVILMMIMRIFEMRREMNEALRKASES